MSPTLVKTEALEDAAQQVLEAPVAPPVLFEEEDLSVGRLTEAEPKLNLGAEPATGYPS